MHRGTRHPPQPHARTDHVWVTLAVLVHHCQWGVIALPLLAKLYVRACDLASIPKRRRTAFQTKLELTVSLVKWAMIWLKPPEKAIWIVANGDYAMRPFLKPVLSLGVTVLSRLRKDASRFSLPQPPRKKQRSRPRKKGEQQLRLAKRAGAKSGWSTGTFSIYGQPATKNFKTFFAYWGPAGGAIRVVLVKDADRSWRGYFCTDTTASVADILETVADRFAIETAFRDVKEIVGAGQQQTRRHDANIGGFHLCLWMFTMTEARAWNHSAKSLTD